MARIEIIDTDAATICDHGFCGFKDAKHEGYKRKTDWLKRRFAEGLKFKVLQVDGVDAGMIEYIPGEQTWRPVDARGYMVIHCLMIAKKKYKGQGYGLLLIEDCVADTKRAGMAGVAVVASRGTWMVGPEVFLRRGFACVDTAPPSFELLAKKLRKARHQRSEPAGTGHSATMARDSRSSRRISVPASPSAQMTSSKPAGPSAFVRRWWS